MKTRTAAVAALAALAIPVTSQAAKPAEPGKQGRDNAAQKQSAAKTKSVGFSLKGTGLATLPVTDNKLTGALTVDPSSANQHARRLLDLTKAEIAGTDTVSFGETDDAVKVRFVGLTATDALQATDVVKVIGKVKRTRNADGTRTYGPLDIRRIVIKRPE